MSWYCGVDPGVKGALCVLSDAGQIKFWDAPIIKKKKSNKRIKTTLDIAGLWGIICEINEEYKPAVTMVEEVHSMPHEGVTSAFSFGFTCGVIQGQFTAAGLIPILVTPQAWKKPFGLVFGKDVPKATKKARSIAKFCVLSGLPESVLIPKGCRVPADGRAEAGLLALLGGIRHSGKNI